MMMATFVQNGSVFHVDGIDINEREIIHNGITCELIAPILSLKILEKLMIVINAGTAHGSRKMTPKIRLPLINCWLATTAVKIPRRFAAWRRTMSKSLSA